VVNRLAPRSQWGAITILAILIFTILLVRYYRKGLTPSGISTIPLMVALAGDITRPGIYLMEGPEVTVTQAIEAAGGLRNRIFKGAHEDLGPQKIHNGQLIRVASSQPGSVEIRVETMPAAARLTLGEKLNVNIASEEELMLVPQMKARFAAAIVNHRGKQTWHSLDELEEISGVGPKTVEKWRSYLEANEKGMGGEYETK
jgi:DNA uptake protein ComE-like DNA-binding protein